MPIIPGARNQAPTRYALGIRVPVDMWYLLKQVAARRGEAVQQVIRDALIDEYELHWVMAYPQTKLNRVNSHWANKYRSPSLGPMVLKHVPLPIALVNELYKISDEKQETVASVIRGALTRQYDLGPDLEKMAAERKKKK